MTGYRAEIAMESLRGVHKEARSPSGSQRRGDFPADNSAFAHTDYNHPAVAIQTNIRRLDNAVLDFADKRAYGVRFASKQF
jgi:hypothetical protein